MYNSDGELVSSLEGRVKSITTGTGPVKIAFIYIAYDYGTFRYRCYNICQAIHMVTDMDATFFFVDELESISTILKKIDIVVFSRVPWDFRVESFVQKCIKNGIKLVYDTDDLVLSIKHAPLLINYIGELENIDSWFGYIARRKYLADECSDFITTNDVLASHISNISNRPVHVIPNFLNQEQIAISETILNDRKPLGYDGKIKLGYFSGTSTHNKDFKMISSQIGQILSDNKNVSLKIVGYLDIPDELKEFSLNKRLETKSLVNFIQLQREISECDINLIPLVDSVFTRCKSDLKFFESAVVGTVSVATRNEVYAKSITEKANGSLASQHEWYEKLSFLIKDIQALNSISQNAVNYTLDKYSPNAQKSVSEVFNVLANK